MEIACLNTLLAILPEDGSGTQYFFSSIEMIWDFVV
jgi:hypothetical protein